MTQQGTQVIVRPTSNQLVREYHFVGKEPISRLPYAEFWQPMHGSDDELSSLGTKGKKLASTLLAERNKEMIERITFRTQSVRVYKSPTAPWATVEEQIVIPAIRSSFDPNATVVQYGTARQLETQRELAETGAR